MEISHRDRIIRNKIVYYGPAAGGKTTNLIVLHRCANPQRRGEMVSVNSSQDRTILMDLLPMKMPAFRGYELRFQVVAVPGQRMYAASRRLLLSGVDTVVFVANSAADRWEETLTSLREMNVNLRANGIDPAVIPIVFQYNKRDLPEVTPLEAMDRMLNVRRLDSFPAIAIRMEGVLETFSAALFRTLASLTTRFEPGEKLASGRSVKEWVAESMATIFGWKSSSESGQQPQEAVRTTVRVPAAVSSRSAGESRASAAMPPTDPQAAEVLVESYAEAATRLTSALEEARDERDSTRRRLEELSAPIDTAEELLAGRPPEEVLKSAVDRIGQGLGASKGSLSLIRPDGELEAAVLQNFTMEPLFDCTDATGRPLVQSLLKHGEPAVFLNGAWGAPTDAFERAGGDCAALVAIPVKTHVRSLGLLCYYLPHETPPPRKDSLPHLARLGQGLAMALEVASGAIASERLQRLERTAMVGQLAEAAITEMGTPVDQLFEAVGRIRGRPDGPSWLLGELVGIGTDLVQTKRLRDGVLDFVAGRITAQGSAYLSDIMEWLQKNLAAPLQRDGIKLELVRGPGPSIVRADPFLLRCAVAALIKSSRDYLAGGKEGLIRVAAEGAGAETANNMVRFTVSDNAAAIRGNVPADKFPRWLAWSLDRRVRRGSLALVKAVVEHFNGQWQMSFRSTQGNVVTITLPAEDGKGG